MAMGQSRTVSGGKNTGEFAIAFWPRKIAILVTGFSRDFSHFAIFQTVREYLPLNDCPTVTYSAAVASFTDAWIETQFSFHRFIPKSVASFTDL